MKKLAIIAVLAVVASLGAQTNRFSFAGVVTKNQAYLVAVTPIFTEWTSGNWSIHSDLLFGARVTDPGGCVGIAQTISYQLNRNYSLFAGVSDLTQTSTISPAAWIADKNICFTAGLSGPLDLSIFGLR